MPADKNQELFDYLTRLYQDAGVSAGEADGVTIRIPADRLIDTVKKLHDDPHLDFKMLIDITAVDWPSSSERFEVVYHFLSLHLNHRVRVILSVAEGQTVPSLTDQFPCANWFEREVFDMFGIGFDRHPDMRRILTDYGFEGHPLRKDFPLTGHVELRYDPEAQKVVYEPVKLTQDYRKFDFISPWEGMTDIQLPGDEKAVKQGYAPAKDPHRDTTAKTSGDVA